MAISKQTTIFLALLSLLVIKQIEMASIDATDQCILRCYQCFDNDNLMNCANDCLLFYGRVQKPWTICKYFNDDPMVSHI